MVSLKRIGSSHHVPAPATTSMAVGNFYAFLQCQLRMEARTLMKRDFELEDPAAIDIWPTYEKLELRNQGKNEKWVPFHTVLGVHEFFVVKEIHHADVACWTPWRRFVTMFIFRSHCSRDLFEQVQRPHLVDSTFWRNPCAAFDLGGTLHHEIMNYRKRGNALQTNCFLIIPERLVKDDDENIVQNLMLRTQRLIRLAEELWPMLQDRTLSDEEKYLQTAAKITGVPRLGETWVKMLMVVIDIALPELKLLQRRCEVGTGAMGGLRQLLEAEGVLEHTAKEPVPDKATVYVDYTKDKACVVWAGKRQLLQVTARMAGSLDRARAICARLAEIANEGGRSWDVGTNVDSLVQKKKALLADRTMVVPQFGLEEKEEPNNAGRPQEPPATGATASSGSLALARLVQRINASDHASVDHFWRLLAEVEAHGRRDFAKYPLAVAQMKTIHRKLSAVTVQVQLCEWRQFMNYHAREMSKREAPLQPELVAFESVPTPCKRPRHSAAVPPR